MEIISLIFFNFHLPSPKVQPKREFRCWLFCSLPCLFWKSVENTVSFWELNSPIDCWIKEERYKCDSEDKEDIYPCLTRCSSVTCNTWFVAGQVESSMEKIIRTLCVMQWFLLWVPWTWSESESCYGVALQQTVGKARDLGSCGSSHADKLAGNLRSALMAEDDQHKSKSWTDEFVLPVRNFSNFQEPGLEAMGALSTREMQTW